MNWEQGHLNLVGGSTGETFTTGAIMQEETSLRKAMERYHASADQGRLFRKFTETIAAIAAAGFGLMFLGSGFGQFAFIYYPMAVAAPAAAWGALMLTLGMIRLVVLIVNGWWPHTHLVRKWLSATYVFLVWMPLATCFWWNAYMGAINGIPINMPGLAYSFFTLVLEFVIFYAHASFVYLAKRG